MHSFKSLISISGELTTDPPPMSSSYAPEPEVAPITEQPEIAPMGEPEVTTEANIGQQDLGVQDHRLEEKFHDEFQDETMHLPLENEFKNPHHEQAEQNPEVPQDSGPPPMDQNVDQGLEQGSPNEQVYGNVPYHSGDNLEVFTDEEVKKEEPGVYEETTQHYFDYLTLFVSYYIFLIRK